MLIKVTSAVDQTLADKRSRATGDGTLFVVTEKLGNRLDTYVLDQNGLPSTPIDNASSGMTPFGFSFNNDNFLIVSEAFGGVPNQAAASSYSSDQTGLLSVISGSVRIHKPPLAGW